MPGNTQGLTITSGTKIVRRYNTMTLTNQDNKPNVRIFIGIKSIRKIGATSNISRLKTKPARRVVFRFADNERAGIS